MLLQLGDLLHLFPVSSGFRSLYNKYPFGTYGQVDVRHWLGYPGIILSSAPK